MGVYGFTEREFFQTLAELHINVFIDIRRRRGMRGNQYAFVNKVYLQTELSKRGIRYLYDKTLAPSQAIRALQKEDDRKEGTSKQKRVALSDHFIHEYKAACLDSFDVRRFVQQFDPEVNLLLFCVEARPEACHRSLVAEKLREAPEVTIRHILK